MNAIVIIFKSPGPFERTIQKHSSYRVMTTLFFRECMKHISKMIFLSTLNNLISLINNRIVTKRLRMGASGTGSKVWDWSMGSLEVALYGWVRAGWPLEARRSPFPDWPWLVTSYHLSPHRRALHIPVLILAGKFKIKFLSTVTEKDSLLHRFVQTRIKLFPATKEHYQSQRFAQTHIKLFPVA